jgi:hypothetical protein
MYQTIKSALEKLHADIDAVFVTRFDTWHEGAPVLSFPKVESIPPVATCFIINTVSLLDEALDLFLDTAFPTHPPLKRLRNRIEWLEKQGRLKNPTRLKEIADIRNDYAHELGKYGDVPELQQILKDIENELRNVGVVS